MMPVEPVANWIFKLTEPVDKRRVLTTVVTVMAFVTVFPIASIASGALLLLGEKTIAVTVFAGGHARRPVPDRDADADDEDGAVHVHVSAGPAAAAIVLAAVLLPVAELLCIRLTDWSLWALGDLQAHAAARGTPGGDLDRAAHLATLCGVRKIRAFVYDEQAPPLVTTMEIATQLKQIRPGYAALRDARCARSHRRFPGLPLIAAGSPRCARCRRRADQQPPARAAASSGRVFQLNWIPRGDRVVGELASAGIDDRQLDRSTAAPEAQPIATLVAVPPAARRGRDRRQG